MEFSITKRQWNISKADLKAFCSQKIERTLNAFNQASSGSFYMADYYHNQFIIDPSHALILCGYSKALADEKGFAFFGKILKKDEFRWILQMNSATYKFLFNLPINQRTKAMVSYDLTFIMSDGNEVVLHHKVIPYQLCKNGNVWLGLCHISLPSSKLKTEQATIFNSETGERYSFVDGQFVLLESEPITQEDRQILNCLTKGLTDKQICTLLNNIPLGTLKSKKIRLFSKLDVDKSTSAVHKAHLLGII